MKNVASHKIQYFPLTLALSLCMDREHHERVFGDMVDTLRWLIVFQKETNHAMARGIDRVVAS